MKWNYTNRALPDKGMGWCLLQAKNAKYYIATYLPEAHEWRCQDTAWSREDPACSLRLEENQVLCWVEIMAIRQSIELDENGEEPKPRTYENCKVELADYSDDDAKFTFIYGGRRQVTCRSQPNAEKLAVAMARRRSVDICEENGVVKAVEPHETAG